MYDLMKLGIDRGLFIIAEKRIKYPIQNKDYDLTAEEQVRALTYAKLVFLYSYKPERIAFEVYSPKRELEFPCDLVVYEDTEKKRVFMTIETKPTSLETQIKVAKREGLGNSILLNSKYLMIACGEVERFFDVSNRPSLAELEDYRTQALIAYEIPSFRYKKSGGPFFDLTPLELNELNYKLQLCHDVIWEGGKRDPTIAFDEMSKLLFVKIYDERYTKIGEFYRFQIGGRERSIAVGNRVKEIYDNAKASEPGIFGADIELDDELIYRIVDILQATSLTDTDVDVKGRAFEKFLGAYFRGPAGQYFTPRRIVEFMVAFSDVNEKDVILDPACGSGGFLLHAIQRVRQRIRKYAKNQKEASLIEWDFAHKQVFGIEVNERIARIAMLNMIIHEDAHGNIECNNALQDHAKFDPRKGIVPGKYTLILTNPPLGKSFKETSESVLRNYTIAKKSEVVSVLFVEMCLRYLAKDGLLGIVLDEGILSDPKYQYVRDHIMSKSIVRAIFSLPFVAFKVAGAGAKTSILFLEKKKETNQVVDYPIFIGHVEHVGYDAVGRPDINQLPMIFDEWKKFCKDPSSYKPVLENEIWTTQRMLSQLEGRLDAWHYYPPYLENLDFLQRIPYEKKTIQELCEKKTDIFYPGRTRRIVTDKEQGLPFLSIRHVKEDGISTDKLVYISRNTKNIEDYVINKAWILVTRSGTVGTATVVTDHVDGYCASEHLLRIILSKNVDPHYVACMLNSRACSLQIKRESYGAVIKEISVDSLKNILVPYPSSEETRKKILQIRSEARQKRKEKIAQATQLREEGETILSDAEVTIVSLLSKK